MSPIQKDSKARAYLVKSSSNSCWSGEGYWVFCGVHNGLAFVSAQTGLWNILLFPHFIPVSEWPEVGVL